MRMKKAGIWSVAAGILMALVVGVGGPAAHAQVNTGGLRGSVVGEDGGSMELVEVTLVHEPTKNTKTAYTNAAGEFAFTGLRVGGPYSVTVTFAGFRPAGFTNIFL